LSGSHDKPAAAMATRKLHRGHHPVRTFGCPRWRPAHPRGLSRPL